LRRARFVVAYDGSAFHGFAPNRDVATVMGELTRAFSTVVRQQVVLTGAGRTDAGVHAWGQVISGDLPVHADLGGLVRRVNKLCAPAISVRQPEWTDAEFDARFSATWRQYRYHIWNDRSPNPLLAGISWHVPDPLEIRLMQAGVSPLIGEHDFSSFCRRPKTAEGQIEPSMMRRLYEIGWSRVDETPMLRFEIRGSAFCHQMVRSIVGSLVDVGLRRLTPADLNAMLRARDRNVAGRVAPPHGLVLWAVGYDGLRWDAQERATGDDVAGHVAARPG
jgi:tRNA pseudouridine38-40 synthase